jgi:hypothetical protein
MHDKIQIKVHIQFNKIKLQLRLAYSQLVVIHYGIHFYIFLGKKGCYVSIMLKLLAIYGYDGCGLN